MSPAAGGGEAYKADGGKTAPADPEETGPSGPCVLGVRAKCHRQSLHDVCAARRLAPRQSHRSSYRRGLCSRLERLGRCPLLKTIVLVQDNLNIHSKASLYEAFPAAEARHLVERFERHYTPKHGSRLDLAESELGVLSSQYLDRRIPDKQTLVEEIAAWEHDRNANHTKANWHFTTPNARIKLKHLYPSI